MPAQAGKIPSPPPFVPLRSAERSALEACVTERHSASVAELELELARARQDAVEARDEVGRGPRAFLRRTRACAD